ncbi:MAG: electron transfer flavoprotein beta subunit [bacterium]
MNILVPIKHVVDVELNLRVKDGSLVEDGLQYVMSAWDENAVEAAVVLKENNSAEVTIASIGGDSSTESIRKALAMGGDKGIHVNDENITGDSFVMAKTLEKVIAQGSYDLVILGKQAQDTDSGQTGALLAEVTGLPVVANVSKIEVTADNTLRVSRVGDAGSEIIDVTLPAVITVNDSINEPRLPALRGIMQAKKKKIEKLDAAALGLSADEIGVTGTRTAVLSLEEPAARKAGQKFEGDAAEITATVVKLLSDEAKVL